MEYKVINKAYHLPSLLGTPYQGQTASIQTPANEFFDSFLMSIMLCTWSDGRRLKSAGGFVITYRLLEESAEVSFLSRNLVAKNSLDLSKLGMCLYNLYMWSNCYYSKQMLLFLVEVTNKIKDSEGLFIIRIIYCV